MTDVASLKLQTVGVLTPNPHAFQLTTGLPAPMPTLALNLSYSHMVARLDQRGPQPPAGARLIARVEPWGLFALERPRTREELLGTKDYSWGIPLDR